MSLLNCEWLGYAANSLEATKIVKDTGFFYVMISVGYLVSYLLMFCHSPSVRKLKYPHIIGILVWAFLGECTILQPEHFAVFFNFFVLGLSIVILYHLNFTSTYLSQAALSEPKVESEDKKKMFIETLLKKRKITLEDVLSCSLVNEQILWLLIFYKAAVGFRASLGL